MKVNKIWFKDLPDKLHGDVVVIDAYAASANMSILLSKNPKRLVVINEDILQKARETYPEAILAGESDTLSKSEFVFANGLKAMYEASVEAKEIIWMSVNGSRVFEAVYGDTDGDVLSGSFQNAQAIANYLKDSQEVNIIMSGNRKKQLVFEDSACADFIEAKLTNQSTDEELLKKELATFIADFYKEPYVIDDIPFLVEHFDEFDIVPKCIKNERGFLEIVRAS